MNPRLYALLILIGTIGFFVLLYLYFFVYYTATVVIDANVGGYKVDFFAPSTAQKRSVDCPEPRCEIAEVSPFEYNITFSKPEYKNSALSVKIEPRKKQEFVIELEKQAKLEALIQEAQIQETSKQKIQRLREDNLYLASFKLDENRKATFSQKGERMVFELRGTGSVQKIADFARTWGEAIHAEYISDTQKVFLKISQTAYIFDSDVWVLHSLPFEIEVRYIKPTKKLSQFLVVTEKWTFLYDTATKKSEFQYVFRDFVFWQQAQIGVIYDDETQKKENFNLTQKGNIVIYYTQAERDRKVLLVTDLDIDRIEIQGEKVIVSAWSEQFELQNF